MINESSVLLEQLREFLSTVDFHICSTNSQKEKYMVSNWTPKNQFANEISCNNEENARLICTIMNCDNEHKKFNIKAYLKGSDIEKLKAHNEGQEEKKNVCKSKR